MAIVLGSAGELRDLPERQGGNGEGSLKSFSIEGIGALVKPEDAERLKLAGMKGQFVQANYSVQWRQGKAPLHWLTDCKPVSVGIG